jgi:hypothetical protein
MPLRPGTCVAATGSDDPARKSPCNGDMNLDGKSYPSYLKESATLVRKAKTLPPSTFMSIFVTSAMRRSRMDFAAVSTARLAASSQETVLTPTTSTIL